MRSSTLRAGLGQDSVPWHKEERPLDGVRLGWLARYNLPPHGAGGRRGRGARAASGSQPGQAPRRARRAHLKLRRQLDSEQFWSISRERS